MTLQGQIENEIEDFIKTLKPDEIAESIADFNPKKTKLIYGVNFRFHPITDLGTLEVIYGNADFKKSQVQNLGNLTTINGEADFRDSKIKNLGNLTTIGGDADFRSSQVENLGNLTTIGSFVDFSDSSITDLGNLSYIGGNIYANGNKLTKEQIELHLKMMKEINLIRKGSYYISNGEVFIKRNDVGVKKVDYTHFFIRDLKFNDNGTIAMK